MKICDYYNEDTINKFSLIIELCDDYIINGRIYNRYNLLNSGDGLAYFMITNATTDYRFTILNNIFIDVNDYGLQKMVIDKDNSDICYIIYRKINTGIDFLLKIEVNKDHTYEILGEKQFTNLNRTYTNRSYFAKKHLEIITQTDSSVVIFDNFTIYTIKKDLSNVYSHYLDRPSEFEHQDGDTLYFVDGVYSQNYVYNCNTNTMVQNWTNISRPFSKFYIRYHLNDPSNAIPVLSAKYIYKSFKIYFAVQRSGYNEYSFNDGPTGSLKNEQLQYMNLESFNHLTPYVIWSSDYSSYRLAQETITIWSQGSYEYATNVGVGTYLNLNQSGAIVVNFHNSRYNDRVTNFNGYYSIFQMGSPTIYLYGWSCLNAHVINSRDNRPFINLFAENFGEYIIVLTVDGSGTLMSFAHNDINGFLIEFSSQSLSLSKFLICGKYDDNHFLVLFETHELLLYEFNGHEIIKIFTKTNIKIFSISYNNLLIINEENSFEFLTPATISGLNAIFEQEIYNYQNQDIESFITIYAKNFLQNFVKTKIKITLSGPCKFNNNTKTYIGYTDIQEMQIPVIITDAGKCTCNIEEL